MLVTGDGTVADQRSIPELTRRFIRSRSNSLTPTFGVIGAIATATATIRFSTLGREIAAPVAAMTTTLPKAERGAVSGIDQMGLRRAIDASGELIVTM
jgi:hypothetical protein